MKLLTDLFSTDYGLMSIIGLFFIMCMGVFFLRLFLGKINLGAPPDMGAGAGTGASTDKPH